MQLVLLKHSLSCAIKAYPSIKEPFIIHPIIIIISVSIEGLLAHWPATNGDAFAPRRVTGWTTGRKREMCRKSDKSTE